MPAGLATARFSTAGLWTAPPPPGLPLRMPDDVAQNRSQQNSRTPGGTPGLGDFSCTLSAPWSNAVALVPCVLCVTLSLCTGVTGGSNAFSGILLKETNDQKLWML